MGVRIGINAHFFKYPATGIGQYLLHLTNTLLSIDQENEYVILSPHEQVPADFTGHVYPHAQDLPVWMARHEKLAQVWWEQWSVPRVAQQMQLDICHYPYFSAPLYAPSPLVVTIPDVLHFHLPAYMCGGSRRAYMHANLRLARRARMIITLSEHAKQDILALLQIPDERVRVVPIAAGDECHPINDRAAIAQVRARYRLGERYIYYLGGLDQRKNVLQLVHAFARIVRCLDDPALQLLIAGDPEKQSGPLFPDPRPLAVSLGVSGRIRYGFVAEQDKAALYSGASVFVFPSIYEGFGLTPLEAMQCGAPVVCSNRTSLPEVVGDAAISLDPDDTSALVDAICAVLSNDVLRARLCAQSLQRAKLFSWQKTAQATLAVYEQVGRNLSSDHQLKGVPHSLAKKRDNRDTE